MAQFKTQFDQAIVLNVVKALIQCAGFFNVCPEGQPQVGEACL
jgi:hypothetical protein